MEPASSAPVSAVAGDHRALPARPSPAPRAAPCDRRATRRLQQHHARARPGQHRLGGLRQAIRRVAHPHQRGARRSAAALAASAASSAGILAPRLARHLDQAQRIVARPPRATSASARSRTRPRIVADAAAPRGSARVGQEGLRCGARRASPCAPQPAARRPGVRSAPASAPRRCPRPAASTQPALHRVARGVGREELQVRHVEGVEARARDAVRATSRGGTDSVVQDPVAPCAVIAHAG